jgi:hypothetical protein
MSIRTGLILIGLVSYGALGGDTASAGNPAIQPAGGFSETKSGKFAFAYKVDGNSLVARISYPTSGWVAVGFNPVKAMKGANFIIGCVADGKPVVSDEFGLTESSHARDSAYGGKDDIVNGSVITDNGTTTMSFSIPLNSGDSRDVVLEKGKQVKVIFAAGKKPDIATEHNALERATITLK